MDVLARKLRPWKMSKVDVSAITINSCVCMDGMMFVRVTGCMCLCTCMHASCMLV